MKSTKLKDYFALKSARDLAAEVLGRGDSFYSSLRSNFYIDKLIKSWRMYHGVYQSNESNGHEITFTGDEGELTMLPVNHYRNIAQHMLSMVTANRPVMEARAVNSDVKSIAQTYLANQILDYYMKEKKVEDAVKTATEYGIVLGAGFIKLSWNATGGEIYNADPENPMDVDYEGELEVSVHSPFDLVTDGSKERWDNEWILVRSYVNRFTLMAKYPELEDSIATIDTKTESTMFRLAVFSNDKTDDIPVYEFFHRKTEAVPEGRYVQFLSPECVLIDTPMPYATIPVFRIAPSDILGTPYGYTTMFDLMPIQEGINMGYSTIITNQNAFGVQNVFVPKGADIAQIAIAGGLNIIEANAKPEPINLTQTPAEVFKFLEMLIQSAETISGVNSVARGNPEASLKSGTALALVQSMALQYISGLQQSYVRLIEDLGTGIIQILKDFVATPKTVALIGKQRRVLMKEFTGNDIAAINRVVVDVGNPLSHTTAGRVQMAEQMLQMQIIKTPQQYFEVINTGRLDVMYEGDMSELIYIREENEILMDGKPVVATAIDQHKNHILEHRSVLASSEARKDPTLIKNVLDHIQQHIDLLRNTDPALLQMIGETPLQNNPSAPKLEETESEISLTGLRQSTIPQQLQTPQGPIQPGNQIPMTGVAGEAPLARQAALPQVNPALLVNPGLQEQVMGNVKGMLPKKK